MELQLLRTFQAVVEEGGVISASHKLNTVQSNVTSRINRLENELNTKLFYRKGRGLELAPSGKLLFEFSKRMLHLEQQAIFALQELGSTTGELRIGSMETYASYKLPRVIADIRSLHNAISLHIETGTSQVLVEKVLDFKLDCAFIGEGLLHDDLIMTDVQSEELVLIHQKGGYDSDSPLILFRDGCIYRARALAWQREEGKHLTDIMELGTLDGILGCVAMGLGCTMMPRWIVENSRYSAELEAKTVQPHIGIVTTKLVHHREAIPMQVLETLIKSASR